LYLQISNSRRLADESKIEKITEISLKKNILRKRQTHVDNRPRQKSEANNVVVGKADMRKSILVTDINQLNYNFNYFLAHKRF
jgi:hypothetical protein